MRRSLGLTAAAAILALVLGLALALGPAFGPGGAARAADQRYPAFGEAPPGRLVTSLAGLARRNLHRARLPDGQPVPKETPEQLGQPLVPAWFDAEIVERAKVSAFAEWCGLDWRQRSFATFMGHARRSNAWQPRQLAYVGLLHGVAMGVFADGVKKRGACPAALKAKLDNHLDALVQPPK